jgi:hypothetical protein
MVVNRASAEEVIELESRLHQPNVRSSPQEVGSLLADSFVEIASSGRHYTRSEIIEDPANEEPRHIDASDFETAQFGGSMIKLTYRTSTACGTALREST